MDSEQTQIKAEVMKKFETELDRVMKKPLRTMTEMENEVARIKNEYGRELLEKLLVLKKTQNSKG